jgi:uncharacterized protein YecT (DUF1311 family)
MLFANDPAVLRWALGAPASSAPQLMRDSLGGTRHMLRGILSVLLSLAPAAVLNAQRNTPASCDSASTTFAMHTCWGQLARQADSTLQRYLAEAERLAVDRALLDSAQVAWRQYRDLSCRGAGGQFQGGTLEPVTIVICIYQATRARTRDLWEAYMSNADSNLPEPDAIP